MGTRDLPDMYAQSPRAAGPRAEDIHIRRITSAHVTSTMYHFRHSKICLTYSPGFALPIYITMSIHFDYGILLDVSMTFIYSMLCSISIMVSITLSYEEVCGSLPI